MSIIKIFNHVNRIDTDKLLFASDTPSEYYFNILKSYEICLDLLTWQMGYENIKSFLQDILDVLEKVRPKVNTLFILGAPNSGKNFFFDSVIHLMINYGQMGNFTRHDNFPLQECVQRRVILWNEPAAESGSFETLKTILGGDTCNVKVKYMMDHILHRTPVIILSNNDIFPKDPAFNSRIIKHKWRGAPFLRDHKLKIHPLTLIYLFYSMFYSM